MSNHRIRPALLTYALLVGFGTATGCSQAATSEPVPVKPVSVFPAPGTKVASDRTTFSFRGLKDKTASLPDHDR